MQTSSYLQHGTTLSFGNSPADNNEGTAAQEQRAYLECDTGSLEVTSSVLKYARTEQLLEHSSAVPSSAVVEQLFGIGGFKFLKVRVQAVQREV